MPKARAATAPPTVTGKASSEKGFTYVAVLFSVALVGLGLASLGTYWSAERQRERERELLFIGDQFAVALWRYYEASPNTKEYPKRLEDLVEDRRQQVVKRHLRRIYEDPFSGQPEWGIVRVGGQISGVHSLSAGKPQVKFGFPPGSENFASAAKHSDWIFIPRSPHTKPGSNPEAQPGSQPRSPGTGSPNTTPTPTNNSGDQSNTEPPPPEKPEAPPPSACDGQRSADFATCLGNPSAEPAKRQRCFASAGLRYGECLAHGAAKRPLLVP